MAYILKKSATYDHFIRHSFVTGETSTTMIEADATNFLTKKAATEFRKMNPTAKGFEIVAVKTDLFKITNVDDMANGIKLVSFWTAEKDAVMNLYKLNGVIIGYCKAWRDDRCEWAQLADGRGTPVHVVKIGAPTMMQTEFRRALTAILQ